MTPEPGLDAARILERESHHLQERAAEAAQRTSSPAGVLAAVADLLSLRSRYFGIAGEHLGVQEFEGIRVVDALDERLLRAVHDVLRRFVDKHRENPPSEKVMAKLAKRFAGAVPEGPKYPVGYVVLFAMRTLYERFQEAADAEGGDLEELERGMIHYLTGLADRYVQSRERPVVRHLSDVERELAVVRRMKCACGEEKFEVRRQAFEQDPGGAHLDRLDLRCRSCGAERTVAFELPHFKDVYQL